MKENSADKRRSSRARARLCIASTEVSALATPQVVNISEHGAFFHTDQDYQPGGEIATVIGDPWSDQFMVLRARVVRAVEGQRDWKWGYGVEFIDLSEREMTLIKEIKRLASVLLPRILLRVSDEALQKMIRANLPKDEFDTIFIDNIEEMQAVTKSEKPTLLVAETDGSDHELDLLQEAAGDAAVLIISKDYGPNLVTRAGKYGIFESLRAPVDPEAFINSISRGIESYHLCMETTHTEESTSRPSAKDVGAWIGNLPDFVGTRGVMASVNNDIRRMAKLDCHVLLVGAAGTGKEVAAKWIHLLSDRRSGPFVVINMAVISASQIESELYEVLDRTRGGTLLIKGLHLIPFEKQGIVLRLLTHGDYQRPNRKEAQPVDCRILSSCHRDLQSLVFQGELLADLYYRVNEQRIRIPSLDDRVIEDRHELALQIIQRKNPVFGTCVSKLGHDAFVQLINYHWPGNVRELEMTIARSLPGNMTDSLESFDLGASANYPDQPGSPGAKIQPDYQLNWSDCRNQAILALERSYLIFTLDEAAGDTAAAADKAGISRAKYEKKLKKHDLDDDLLSS